MCEHSLTKGRQQVCAFVTHDLSWHKMAWDQTSLSLSLKSWKTQHSAPVWLLIPRHIHWKTALSIFSGSCVVTWVELEDLKIHQMRLMRRRGKRWLSCHYYKVTVQGPAPPATFLAVNKYTQGDMTSLPMLAGPQIYGMWPLIACQNMTSRNYSPHAGGGQE